MAILPVAQSVSSIVLRGRTLQGQLAEALTDATLTVSTDTVAELSMTFYDPSFDLLEAGLFVKGAAVNLLNFAQEITVIETGAAPNGLGQTTVRCRSRAVGAIKRRRGRLVLRSHSPSDFVIRECKAAGVKYVVQPSARRKQVARDTKRASIQDPLPSSWTTFERLAREVGFLLFECAGVIYFGKPSWLRRRTTRLSVLTWNTGGYTDTRSVPEVRSSLDDPTEVISASVEVPRSRLADFMIGGRVRLRFPPFGNDNYLVTGLTYPIAGSGDASVTVSLPSDPTPEPPAPKSKTTAGSTGSKNKGGKGKGGNAASGKHGKGSTGAASRQLGDLLHAAGFRGQALKVACGIAIAESGGVANGRPYANAKAIGDTSLQDAKWGPSVGVFQIRSLKHPNDYSGDDRLRVRSKLDDALYNAKAAFKISNGGKNWGAWSVYTSGRYKAYVGKTNATVRGWGGSTSAAKKNSKGPAATSPKGRKSAHDFVAKALAQVGDKYVYGAEAHGKNPSAFDCSELVEWAADQVGCYMPDGSGNQMQYMRNHGTTLSIDKAIRTRGALLWKEGHIAISLGDGRTVEAVNPSYGVTRMSARDRSFKWQGAGKVPGMRYG